MTALRPYQNNLVAEFERKVAGRHSMHSHRRSNRRRQNGHRVGNHQARRRRLQAGSVHRTP